MSIVKYSIYNSFEYFIFMFNFECSSELLADGVVGDGVQEEDVPGDGHVRRQVVLHVLHHRLAAHAGALRTNQKKGSSTL